jgi:hypothetical protein
MSIHQALCGFRSGTEDSEVVVRDTISGSRQNHGQAIDFVLLKRQLRIDIQRKVIGVH